MRRKYRRNGATDMMPVLMTAGGLAAAYWFIIKPMAIKATTTNQERLISKASATGMTFEGLGAVTTKLKVCVYSGGRPKGAAAVKIVNSNTGVTIYSSKTNQTGCMEAILPTGNIVNVVSGAALKTVNLNSPSMSIVLNV